MNGRAPFLFLGLLVGFFSLAAQALLFREHLLAYAGNEVGIAVFLSAWMLWVGAGGALGRCLATGARAGKTLPSLLLLCPAALVGQLLLFWSLRRFSGAGPTEPLTLPSLIAWTLLLAAPVSLLTGFLFTCVAKAWEQQSGEGASATAARLYGIEALGGLAGGLLATAAALVGAPVLPCVLGLLLAWLLGAAWFARGSGASSVARWCLLAAVATSVAWLAGGQAVLERQRLAALPIPQGLEVLETADTPYQHVLVAAWGSTRGIYSNGELTATLPGDAGVTAEAALLLSQKPDAREVLVLGGGAEPLVCELLRVPSIHVTYVSNDACLAEITTRHLAGDLTRCITSPSVRHVTADPRGFLARSKVRFDVVVARFGDPRTAQAARFYTVEFFRLVRSALSSGGLFSLSISTAENVLADAGLAYAAGVHSTVSAAFEHVVFTSGRQMTLFAASEPGVASDRVEELEGRFEPLRQYYAEVETGFVGTRFEQGRISALGRAFAQTGAGVIATDESPSVFLLNLLVEYRATRLYESFRSIRARLLPGLLLALGCLAVALHVGRWRRGGKGSGRSRGAALIAVAGISGILSQIVLLLGYQVRFGSLLAEFGLLNALYMLGLYLGTASAARVRRDTRMQQLGSSRARGLRAACRGGRGFEAVALVALTLSVALVLALVSAGFGATAGFLLRGVFLLVCLVTGCAAAWVVVAGTRALEDAGMPVEGVAAVTLVADNAGAVAGALGGGLLVLPAAGLSGCALLAAALPVVPLLSTLPAGPGPSSSSMLRDVPSLALKRALVFSWLLLGAFGWLLPAWVPEATPEPMPVAASVALPAAGRDADRGPAASGAVSLSSARVAPEMGGYGGPMDVVVDLDATERVTGIRLARHVETPEYVWDIDEWMAGLMGREAPLLRYGVPADPNGVEALTGATVTARAIVDIARTLGRHQRAIRLTGAAPAEEPAATSLAVRPPGADPSRPAWFVVRELLEPHAWWILLLVGLGGIFLYVRGHWRARLVFLGVCAGLIGVLLNRQMALDQLVLVASGAIPSASHLALWVMLGLLVTVPVLGAVYCGYLCPFGALTDLLSLAGLRWTVPPSMDRLMRGGKYALAAGLVLALALGASRSLLAFDPLSFAFRLDWDALAAAILLLLLGASLVWHRPWCRYLCPLGGCLSAGEGIALAGGPLPARRTPECHLGVHVGRDWDCVRCNRCVHKAHPEPRYFLRRVSAWALPAVLAAVIVLGGARVWQRSGATPGGHAAASSAPDREVSSVHVLEPLPPDDGGTGEPSPSPSEEPAPGIAVAPGSEAGPRGASAPGEPEAPRLERKDNEPYPEQRRVDRERILDGIERGTVSNHEAEFYLPVP